MSQLDDPPHPPPPPGPQSAPPPDDVANFAADLRELRARGGAPSYATLSRRTGVPRSTLHDGLHGERLPSLDTVVALVGALHDDVDPWRDRWCRIRVGLDGPDAGEPDGHDTGVPTIDDHGTDHTSSNDTAGDPGPRRRGRWRRRRWRRYVIAAVVAVAVGAGAGTWAAVASHRDCRPAERYAMSAAGDLVDAHNTVVEHLRAGSTVSVISKQHTAFAHRYLAVADGTGRRGYVDESKIDFRGDVCR